MSRPRTSPETFTARPSPAKETLALQKRLEEGVRALGAIDECRRATNDPNAGLAFERRIVARELLDLDEPCPGQASAQTPRVVRNIVIPVRRIPLA